MRTLADRILARIGAWLVPVFAALVIRRYSEDGESFGGDDDD